MTKKIKNKTAFSLVELSIVLLIVGLIIAAIAKGSAIFAYNRLVNARTITNSSPVSSTPDLTLWLESTSEDSFISSEIENSNPKLSIWRDLNPLLTIKKPGLQPTDYYKPLYVKNCINSLPCVRFTDYAYFNSEGTFMNDSPLTIFVVEQMYAADAGNFLSADAYFNIGGNNFFTIGYGSSSSYVAFQTFYQYGYSFFLPNYTVPIPRIYSIVIDPSQGVVTYLNGAYKRGDGYTGAITGNTFLTIGAYNGFGTYYAYKGDIGELIIFTRGLDGEERRAIEAYLGKKWKIPVS